jgi:hypothetical protein
MSILHRLLTELKDECIQSEKGKERGAWTGYTLLATILPGNSAQTSHLFRVLHVLLGFTTNGKKPHYSFIASPKIPWDRRWPTLWIMIPDPRIDGRLLVALDEYVNPQTGKNIFGGAKVFDHAAKKNQSPYPWAQLVVPSVWLRRSPEDGPVFPSARVPTTICMPWPNSPRQACRPAQKVWRSSRYDNLACHCSQRACHGDSSESLRRKAHGAVCYLHCHAENAHVPYSGDVGISPCAVGCSVYFRPQLVCYPDQNGKTGWNRNV